MPVTPERLLQLLANPERVSFVQYGQSGISILVRRFMKVGTEEEQRAVQEALATPTVTNPIAGGEPYPGTWRLVSVQDGKVRRPEDTQGVYQTLAKGEFIVDPEGRIVQENCETRTRRIYYVDVQTLPVLPTPEQGQTVSMGPVAFNRELNTYSTYIEITTAKTPPAVTVITRKTVKSDVTETVRRGITTPPTPPPLTPGKTYNASINIKNDCTIDAKTSVETAPVLNAEQITLRGPTTRVEATIERNSPTKIPLPTSAPIGETIQGALEENPDGTWDRRLSRETAPHLQQASIRKALTSGGVTEDVSTGERNKNVGSTVPMPTSSPEPGKVVTFERRMNPDGTWDVDERIDNRPPTVAESERNTPTGGQTVANTASGATLKPFVGVPAPAQGQIQIIERRENPDGSWEGTLRIDTSPVLETYEETSTTKRKTIGHGAANARDPRPEPTAATPGKTIRFQRRKNEDGTWTWSEVIEDGALAPLVSEVYEEAFCRTIASVSVERGLPTKPNADAVKKPTAAGVVRTTKLIENVDGTWDKEITDRVAPSLSSTETIVRTKGGISVEVHRNQTGAKPAPPAAEIGKTKTHRVDDNPDCTWDATVRVETAPALERRRIEIRNDQTVEITGGLNQPTKISEASAGLHKITTAENDENPDGTWNTMRRVATPIAVDTGWIGYVDKDGTSYVRAFRNKSTVPTDGFTNQTQNSLGVQINEFGLFEGTGSRNAIPDRSGGSSGDEAWNNFTKEITIKRWEAATIQGMRKKRLVTYSVGVKQTTSQNIAYAYIDGKENGNVDIIRGGRYFRATYANRVSATEWESDE